MLSGLEQAAASVNSDVSQINACFCTPDVTTIMQLLQATCVQMRVYHLVMFIYHAVHVQRPPTSLGTLLRRKSSMASDHRYEPLLCTIAKCTKNWLSYIHDAELETPSSLLKNKLNILLKHEIP